MSVEDMDNFLEHYGVKGMKWGVVNEDKPEGSRDSGTKEYIAALSSKKVSKEEESKNLKENKEKFLRKFDSPKAPSSSQTNKTSSETKDGFSLTDNQKTALKVALGVGAVGLAGVAVYKGHKYLNPAPGSSVTNTQYKLLTALSQKSTWNGTGYVMPSSFDREEFTLPAGHTFFRISTNAEGEHMGLASYVTHNADDFNRYVAAFRQEKEIAGFYSPDFYKVNFKTTKPVKVPNLKTVLDTLRDDLEASNGYRPSLSETVNKYNEMSGGDWNSSTASQLFKSLSKKGYGALVDEMDAGVIGDTPLVLFQRETSKVVAKKMSQSAIIKSESSLTEIAMRKSKKEAARYAEERLASMLSGDEEAVFNKIAKVEHSNQFLEHYGVKGMKWGQRKARSAKEQKAINRRAKARDKRRTLSDQELQSYINRLQSEKKMKDLVDEDLAPGKTALKKIMSDSGQKVARTVIAGTALYAIKVAIERKFNLGDAAGYIAPKPKK